MNTKLNDETINAAPRDAATVILLRDGPTELEVLLLCRGNSKTVMNKSWVFPGGKLDQSDFAHTSVVTQQLPKPPQQLLNEPDLELSHACALFSAACRETFEETAVQLEVKQLHPWSRWITPTEPSVMKKRFDARFFAALLPQGQVAVHDGNEATDSQWLSPAKALQHYAATEMSLAPPQIMTLITLCNHTDTDSVLKQADVASTYCIAPEVIKSSNQSRTLVYPGDPQHSDNQQLMPGPTRLIWKDGYFQPPAGFDAYWVSGKYSKT